MRRKAAEDAAVPSLERRYAGSQSAMEYLMTYGWAILIIAVVLGALYSLGVFNTANLQPKVPGGGCHVFRPNGPGTSWNINLVGSCQSALPQYVAQFNGQSSVIQLPAAVEQSGADTISLWVYVALYSSKSGVYPAAFGAGGLGTAYGGISFTYYPSGNTWYYDAYNSISTRKSIGISTTHIPPHTWALVTFTWDGTSGANAFKAYVDGALQGETTGFTGSISWNGVVGDLPIGGGALIGNPISFNGSIANVQIYNASLSANQIQYLYEEGIGGMPVDLQNLVGWWPLNGDATDYSGNNNNGVPTAISFNGSWAGAYYH